MKRLSLILIVMLSFGMAACENGRVAATKQEMGTVLGGVFGGLAGAQIGDGRGQIAAAVGGALLGSMIGSSIGNSLDRADQAYAQDALYDAHDASIGETISWNNPDSGHSGTYTPVRDGYAASGSYCREYQQTITVGGKYETAYGTACRQPDGTWKIVG